VTPTITAGTKDPAIVAGSLLCPKCGERPRRLVNGRPRGYCLECVREWDRGRSVQKKNALHRCEMCGKSLPHRGGRCPVVERLYLIQRARHKLNERWPGYGDVVTDDDFLSRVGKMWPRIGRTPLPSAVFAGLDPALDDRLIRDGRDKDVPLCHAVAAVPTIDQREFYELYLLDPDDARHWAALPRWKRVIRKGDPDDIQIWKFFTMQRLNMEQAASEISPAWSMASQGAQLPQMFGAIDRLSPAGVRKLCSVMSSYGSTLQDGRPVGDVVTKPWLVKATIGDPHVTQSQ